MGDMQPLQVSVSEACRLMGVCKQTLYRMKAAGQITLNKTRGRTHVPMHEINRIVGVPTQATVVEPVVEPKKLKVKKRKLFPRVA